MGARPSADHKPYASAPHEDYPTGKKVSAPLCPSEKVHQAAPGKCSPHGPAAPQGIALFHRTPKHSWYRTAMHRGGPNMSSLTLTPSAHFEPHLLPIRARNSLNVLGNLTWLRVRGNLVFRTIHHSGLASKRHIWPDWKSCCYDDLELTC